MDAQVLAAVIGAGATICAAIIGTLVVQRRSGSRSPAPDASPPRTDTARAAPGTALEFVDVSVHQPADWHDDRTRDGPSDGPDRLDHPGLPRRAPAARWSVRKGGYDEGADLPLQISTRNVGDAPVLVSRVGVELVAGMNAWYTGIYYGHAPKAREIDAVGAYELDLGRDPSMRVEVRRVMDADPDDTVWFDLEARCAIALPKPVLVDAHAPFVYRLNLKRFDVGMPTHSRLRLWLVADGHEIRSDELAVTFGR